MILLGDRSRERRPGISFHFSAPGTCLLNECMNKGWLEGSAVPPSLSSISAGLGASGKNSAPTVVTGIAGGSMTLSLNISVETEIEHVTWTCSQKALAFAKPEGLAILMDKNYEGRLNWSWRYLSINNLTLEDAGSYKAQINRNNYKVTTYKEFTLNIYG